MAKPDRGRGRGRESLREATEPWWTDHVEPNLAQSTVLSYANVLDRHLLPRLGATPIREINPARVLELQRHLRTGGVGDPMAHRILMVLSGIMRHAVLRGRLDRNPVQPVRVVQPKRRRAIRPLAPVAVESIRRALLDRGDEASATLVSLMAYAGLRPAEATALTWRHVGDRTLLVEQSADGDGETKVTKTGVIRTVPLLAPLAEDLAAWRAASSPPSDEAPIATLGRRLVDGDRLPQLAAAAALRPGRRVRRPGGDAAVRPAPLLRQPDGPGRLLGRGARCGAGAFSDLAPYLRTRVQRVRAR